MIILLAFDSASSPENEYDDDAAAAAFATIRRTDVLSPLATALDISCLPSPMIDDVVSSTISTATAEAAADHDDDDDSVIRF
jgi:hypothetical protein